ncbi:MAG: HAD-IA family hydrolase [Deltaproteobacteria bacterium]|nr:HAD-IA family hydrolase [Candidatus Anaeroferrophillus wilburensis]MBN2888717.1 HAD-IA family hydrolase [Deltaproteobacteria bacterium]
MKFPVQVLFFDLDGTLADTLPDIARAVNVVRRENGRKTLSDEQVRPLIGDGARLLMERAMGAADDRWFQRFLDVYRLQPAAGSRVYPGIFEVLLRYEHKLLACVTNKPKDLALQVLADLDILSFFQEVIGPEDVLRKKPAPDGLQLVLKRFGVAGRQAVMIGDHHTDLRAAAAAGVASCFCRYGYGHDDGLPADASISRPEEIIHHFY